jgi:hypothetical protein
MLDDGARPDGRADTAWSGGAWPIELAARRVIAHAYASLESASGGDPCADSAKNPETHTQANARAQPCSVARATSRMQAD